MSSSAPSTPPQPAPDPDTQGFWDATAAGTLALCRCVACRTWLQPPLERCRACAGSTRFETVSGRGTLYSFIVTRQRVRAEIVDLPGGAFRIPVFRVDEPCDA